MSNLEKPSADKRKNSDDMKQTLIEMISKANDRQIERLFFFIRAYLSQ